MASIVKAAYGTLDVLVNNAAVYKLGPLEATTEEEFHREFNTNVLGPLLMIREAVKYFGPRGGSIINIGSMASQLTPPNLSIYTATKGALDAITGVLAKELGPRQIRVNSINPGATATEGARAAGIIGVGSDYEKQMIALTPLGRVGQPSDIAPIAVFLASDESSWLTGDLISPSGGWRWSTVPCVFRQAAPLPSLRLNAKRKRETLLPVNALLTKADATDFLTT